MGAPALVDKTDGTYFGIIGSFCLMGIVVYERELSLIPANERHEVATSKHF
jgi:hypothetical protein